MVERICLAVNDSYADSYICNESYYNALLNNKSVKSGCKYQVLSNKLISCMEDLISYCLTYNVDVTIPEEYKVTKTYNIIFSTGNFEPSDRECSTCRSSIVLSSTDKEYIEKKFGIMCKSTGKTPNIKSYGHYFCWHTEDFAHNQVIHSYNIDESYIVERVVDLYD